MSSLKKALFKFVEIDAANGKITLEEMKRRQEAMGYFMQNLRYCEEGDIRQMQEAMTTAHFSSYFADTLSRMFYAAYNRWTEDWSPYIYPDEAPDFRTVDRYRLTLHHNMRQRREKATSKTTYYEEETPVTWGVDEFFEQLDVSWRAIVNDDLAEIRRAPTRMAENAGQWLASFVSNLYDNAVSQAALVAAGAAYSMTGRLTAANLAIGIAAVTSQRVTNTGDPLKVRRLMVVTHPINNIQSDVILQSIQMAGVALNDKNVLPNFVASVHYDPFITIAPPAVPWYLFVDPQEIPGVTLGRMRGWPAPVVYKRRSDIEILQGTVPAAFLLGSYDSGDIEYTVHDIVGARDDATWGGITDERGVFYSSGTTP